MQGLYPGPIEIWSVGFCGKPDNPEKNLGARREQTLNSSHIRHIDGR